MTGAPAREARAAGDALLAGYDRALPQVYGYLIARVGSPAVAEDLTSETFLAAVDAIGRGRLEEPTTAWLIGVARHKLVDHWRRQAREDRRLHAVADTTETVEDPWDAHLETRHALEVLGRLGPHHRSALVLRYLDGLPVPEVAAALGRTLHATEALLVRARRAFRHAYEAADDTTGDSTDHDPIGDPTPHPSGHQGDDADRRAHDRTDDPTPGPRDQPGQHHQPDDGTTGDSTDHGPSGRGHQPGGDDA